MPDTSLKFMILLITFSFKSENVSRLESFNVLEHYSIIYFNDFPCINASFASFGPDASILLLSTINVLFTPNFYNC
jgi:hypothetical protein